MILLSGHSLTPDRKVPLESLSLSLKERESEARMIPADMSGINLQSWFRDETNPGAGIVWRVRSIQTAYAIATPTVTLEHIINTLRDRILFGEVNAETISGNRTCTGEEAVRYILDRQGDWRLGTFGFNVSSPYDFSGDTLYAALERVTQTCDDAMWTFDMSSYPFTLNIIPKPSGIGSEMRLNRNITAITRTIDRSSMYTRFYPIGKDDLHISEEYISRNDGTYGVISKVEVDTTLESEDELRAWANERLRKHADPEVTVEVEGLELADATGESLDRIRLGRICRIPMPEFGTTIEERVTGLDYEDKVHSPELVTVTLSNQSADVARNVLDVIAESIMEGSGPSGSGRGGGGGRGGAQQAKEDHAWFEDTDEHVAMCAEGIIGKDANGNPNWVRLSQIVVDGKGIHQTVEEIQNGNVIRDAKIETNEREIRQEVADRSEMGRVLQGKITVEADRITQEVTRASAAEGALRGAITVEADRITEEVQRANFAEGVLDGKITVEAGKITQIVTAVGVDGKVTAASICLAINNGGSTATINAGKIYLLGQTIADTITADYISTKIASLAYVSVKRLSLQSGGSVSWGNGASITDSIASDLIKNLRIELTGNTYKLQKVTVGDASWQDVGSFSRAVTSWGVGWSNGTCTVTANPQSQSTSIVLSNISGTNSITANGTYTYKVMYEDSGGDDQETGLSKDVVVNIPDRYSAGYVAGGSTAKVSGSNSITSNGTYTYKGVYVDQNSDDVETGNNLSVSVNVPQGVLGLTAWNSGTSSTLYYWDTSALGYKVATGSGKRWYYKE